MALLLLAGCGTTEDTPPDAEQVPGITVDSITFVGGVKLVEYRDAKTGDRYQLRAMVGDTGWIESVTTKDKPESVRIEWTPTTVYVEASQPDGRAQVYYAGLSSGIGRIKPDALDHRRKDHTFDQQPFLLYSTSQADELLGAPQLGATMGMVNELLSKDVPAAPMVMAQTFPCDQSLDISDNCAVEAKMAKNDQTIFTTPAGTFAQDKNEMKLKCGDQDGLVRIQACPLSAYDCTKPGNAGAKVEQQLAASAAQDDKDKKTNEACRILAAEDEGIDVGKKFDVKGMAEIRPGKVVRPKDPSDEAKHPDGCKLVWEFPEKTSRVYHSQFVDGYTKDTTERTNFEFPITAAAATGSLAIGGKSLIDVRVQTCQDAETGSQDDYAIIVRGTKTNELYTCAGP